MSNVRTVNWLANCAATCSYDAQSPSPEGTNTTCGPLPRCSQYQSMPSVLCSNRRTDSTLNPRVALNEASCWSHESYHLGIALAARISKCRNRRLARFGASVPRECDDRSRVRQGRPKGARREARRPPPGTPSVSERCGELAITTAPHGRRPAQTFPACLSAIPAVSHWL